MALALHKVVVAASPDGLSAARTVGRVEASRLAVSASPIVQPWWRSLGNSLVTAAAVEGRSGQSSVLQSQRWHSVMARAAESEVAESREGDGSEEAESEGSSPSSTLKTKALTKQVKHIMNILNDEAVAAATKDKQLPDIRTGDIIAMRLEVPENKRRVSLIRGIVIAKNNAGINSTFRIRRVLAGVGVEMVFPLYSPNIKELKVVDKRKVRRAKLYYLRDKIARLSTIN